MAIYAGLDVSDKTTHICGVTGDGAVVRRDVVNEIREIRSTMPICAASCVRASHAATALLALPQCCGLGVVGRSFDFPTSRETATPRAMPDRAFLRPSSNSPGRARGVTFARCGERRLYFLPRVSLSLYATQAPDRIGKSRTTAGVALVRLCRPHRGLCNRVTLTAPMRNSADPAR